MIYAIGLFVLVFMPAKQLEDRNLVTNGSFEVYDECPRTYTEKGQKIDLPNWHSPSRSTPDYYNSCCRFDAGVPANIMGYQWAKEGEAYIGLVLAEHPDRRMKKSKQYREYIQTRLSHALQKDSMYSVSFWYCLAPHSTFAVNQLGICLSETKLKGRYGSIESEGVFVSIDTSLITKARGEWIAVSDTIVANGGEKYLTIGNFMDDASTRFDTLNLEDVRRSLRNTIRENGFAYYYIDMVEVRKIAPED